MTVSLTPPESRAMDAFGYFQPPWKQWLDALFKAQRIPRSFAFDPASVAAGSTSAQTVTVPRLTPDMDVHVIKPTHTAGLIVGGAFVSAADHLTIVLGNVTAGAIDAPAEVWRLIAWRR